MMYSNKNSRSSMVIFFYLYNCLQHRCLTKSDSALDPSNDAIKRLWCSQNKNWKKKPGGDGLNIFLVRSDSLVGLLTSRWSFFRLMFCFCLEATCCLQSYTDSHESWRQRNIYIYGMMKCESLWLKVSCHFSSILVWKEKIRNTAGGHSLMVQWTKI